VTPRRIRTQRCGEAQARQRLARAQSFLEVAELTADESDPALEYGGVAASVAILAGIAAADAACCQELGRRSRSESHHDAEHLLKEIGAEGERAATCLHHLIDLKDHAHYGFINVTAPELKRSLRQAKQLVEFAEATLPD
jgi:hypothetical protein